MGQNYLVVRGKIYREDRCVGLPELRKDLFRPTAHLMLGFAVYRMFAAVIVAFLVLECEGFFWPELVWSSTLKLADGFRDAKRFLSTAADVSAVCSGVAVTANTVQWGVVSRSFPRLSSGYERSEFWSMIDEEHRPSFGKGFSNAYNWVRRRDGLKFIQPTLCRSPRESSE